MFKTAPVLDQHHPLFILHVLKTQIRILGCLQYLRVSLELFGGLINPPLLLEDPVDHFGVVVRDPKLLGCFMAAQVAVLDQAD